VTDDELDTASISIESATDADREALATAHRASIEGVTDAYDDDQQTAWADAVSPERYPIDGDTSVFRIATRGSDILGVGWLDCQPAVDAFDRPVDAELTALYVRPTAAGAGVGSRLYTHLECAARDRGAKTIGLWASKNAISFYERHGYAGITERTLAYQSLELPVLEMYKRLE